MCDRAAVRQSETVFDIPRGQSNLFKRRSLITAKQVMFGPISICCFVYLHTNGWISTKPGGQMGHNNAHFDMNLDKVEILCLFRVMG